MKNVIRTLRSERDWSQAELASRLGVSRQAVNAMETGKTAPSLTLAMRVAWIFGRPVEEIFIADLEEKMSVLRATWSTTTAKANAFNETRILKKMGRDGWELTSFGVGVLRFRRPDDAALRPTWEYRRLEGLMSTGEREAAESEGWTFCGSWMSLYHYFKRIAPPI